METMSTAFAHDYGSLLSETQPGVIQNEEENERLTARLEELVSRGSLTAAEEKLVELLTLLVNEFESKHYPMEASGPLAVIRHLMESNHLRQKDLVDVFGTESIVSDVLNGKRDLTKEHIKRLSARFGISPAAFF
ncbi:MAG: helix-turn-helix domain-containing protein [Terriglobales bacterium]